MKQYTCYSSYSRSDALENHKNQIWKKVDKLYALIKEREDNIKDMDATRDFCEKHKISIPVTNTLLYERNEEIDKIIFDIVEKGMEKGDK